MTERINKPAGRYYKRPDRSSLPILSLMSLAPEFLKAIYPGEESASPSVTTILSALAKPALIKWSADQERKKVVYLAAQLYRKLITITDEPVSVEKFMEILDEEVDKPAHRQLLEKASHVGTEVHALIEWVFKGELNIKRPITPPLLTSKQAERAFEHWQDWRKAVKLKLISTEKTIFSSLFKYGGTSDFVGEMEVDGKVVLVLGDFKTGKAIYEESYLQNIAYRMALKEDGLNITHGVIVRLPKYKDDPDFEAKMVPDDPMLPIVFIALGIVQRWVAIQKEEYFKAKKEKEKLTTELKSAS